MASIKKEEARHAVLGEYDRWAKKHPNDARMAAFSSSDTYRKKSRTSSISVRLTTRSGKSFTAGYRIGWETNPQAVCHSLKAEVFLDQLSAERAAAAE